MKEIMFYPGESLEEAYNDLQYVHEETNEVYQGEFNGIMISSIDTLDEIYLKVTGKHKIDFDEERRIQAEEYKCKQQEHLSKMPELIKLYREKARGIIPNEYLEKWDQIVPVRLDDLYNGMELDCWLELISELNNNLKDKKSRYEICKHIFDRQGHSGMSANLVLSGLVQLHPLGKKLAEYISER